MNGNGVLLRVGTVVVGVDGSAGSRAALRLAADEAARRGDVLVAVTAEGVMLEDLTAPEPAQAREGMSFLAALSTAPAARAAVTASPSVRVRSGIRRLRQIVSEELGASPASPVQLEVWDGRAARILATRSENARLLVVGARGSGGFRGLRLGSVAQQVLRRVACPVIVVRRWPLPAREEAPAVCAVVAFAPSGRAATLEADQAAAAILGFAADEARMRGAALEVLALGGALLGTHDSADAQRFVAERGDFADLAVRVTVMTGDVAAGVAERSRLSRLVVVGSSRDGPSAAETAAVVDRLVRASDCPVAVVATPAGEKGGDARRLTRAGA